MNFRTVIFSGVVSALLGAMIGLAVATIVQKQHRYRQIIIGGAIVGFVIGSSIDLVRQERGEKEEEYDRYIDDDRK